MRYTVPMPDDSLVPGRVTEEVALPDTVLSTIQFGGRTGTRNGPPWWRPGAAAQRKVEDLIYEWRQARNWFLAAEECLGIALDWDMVADLAVRDESADAPAERRTARSRQLSKRSLAPSQQVEQDMVEAG